LREAVRSRRVVRPYREIGRLALLASLDSVSFERYIVRKSDIQHLQFFLHCTTSQKAQFQVLGVTLFVLTLILVFIHVSFDPEKDPCLAESPQCQKNGGDDGDFQNGEMKKDKELTVFERITEIFLRPVVGLAC
jgi:hypothetical protein